MEVDFTKGLQFRDLGALGAFLLLCFGVAAVGGAVTATSVNDWYQTLAKPGFTPPDWLFAPVWTALYALMAIAGWRVWRKAEPGQRRRPLTVFALQLGLNLAWSVLFFGMNLIGAALVEISVLLGAIILTTILFVKSDPLAGALFVPYALWVGYALLLNTSIWILN
jgi:benzodiazapine receptor